MTRSDPAEPDHPAGGLFEEAEPIALLRGRLRLVQPARGHRPGTDALLLAATLPRAIGEGLAVDLGAGIGTVGLALAIRAPALRVTLVEREPELLACAMRNVACNGLAGRVDVVEQDVFVRAAAPFAALRGAANVVLTNPPWTEAGRDRASPDDLRRRAHHFEPQADDIDGQGLGDPLALWLRRAAALLAPRGRLILIHRADRLDDVLAALPPHLRDRVVLPIHPRAGEPAHRVIVGAICGSRAPLRLLPGLVLHEADGFTPRAAALHDGDAALDLWPERG